MLRVRQSQILAQRSVPRRATADQIITALTPDQSHRRGFWMSAALPAAGNMQHPPVGDAWGELGGVATHIGYGAGASGSANAGRDAQERICCIDNKRRFFLHGQEERMSVRSRRQGDQYASPRREPDLVTAEPIDGVRKMAQVLRGECAKRQADSDTYTTQSDIVDANKRGFP